MQMTSLRRQNRRKGPVAEMNVVPYIDVMLVLLVIFMITAPMLTQGVSVELPEVTAEPLSLEDLEPVVVSVKADGTYYINVGDKQEQATALTDVQDKVAKIMRVQPKTPFFVNGDKSADYGIVVQVMAAMQQAGVPNVGLMTDTPIESTK